MSIRDTLTSAWTEFRGDSTGGTAPKQPEPGKGAGFARRSAANAKPTREAASSVRTASSKKPSAGPGSLFGGGSGLSKEERREERRRQRDKDDFRNRGYDLMLRKNPDYKATDRVWWVLLGGGFAMTIVSLAMVYVFPNVAYDFRTLGGIASIASLVLAYAFIIGAFVFDVVKRRPLRRAVERKVRGMSDKKLTEALERDRAEEAQRQAAKAARRAARKSGK